MNTYYLIIKSHSDAPDIEREIKANSKNEALHIFYKWLGNYGYSKKLIEDNMACDKCINTTNKECDHEPINN